MTCAPQSRISLYFVLKGSSYAANIRRFRRCLLSGRRQHHPIDIICCGAEIGSMARMLKPEQPSSSRSQVSSAVSPSGRFSKSCLPFAHYQDRGMPRGIENHRGGTGAIYGYRSEAGVCEPDPVRSVIQKPNIAARGERNLIKDTMAQIHLRNWANTQTVSW